MCFCDQRKYGKYFFLKAAITFGRECTWCDLRSLNLAHNAIVSRCTPTVLFKIFDTQILPIIDYSSEVCYDRKVKRRLDSWQTIYLKRTHGVKIQTSNLAIFMERNYILYDVYDGLYRHSTANQTKWCTHVGDS